MELAGVGSVINGDTPSSFYPGGAEEAGDGGGEGEVPGEVGEGHQGTAGVQGTLLCSDVVLCSAVL